jgi:outer membrane protein assembly factor BamB/DNA-binding ferritin-like protein (Dps family)
MENNKLKKVKLIGKIMLFVVLFLYIYYSGIFFFRELNESIIKTIYYTIFLVEILVVLAFKFISIKRKNKRNTYEKILNDTFYAEYISVQEKINLSQLSFRKKREVIKDVLEILITAQESGKSIKVVVPDAEKFTNDIVDAYGKWSYGMKEILLGFIYAIIFIFIYQLYLWPISFLINTDHNFFHIKLYSSSLFLAFAYFCIPIVNWFKQRNTELNKTLFLSIIVFSLLIFYVILAILNSGLEWHFLDFLFTQFQLIPNPYILIQYLIIIFILWILMISIRKRVNLDFSKNDITEVNSKKNNTNKQLFVVMCCLAVFLVSTIVYFLNSFNWNEKSVYNTKMLSLDTTLLTKVRSDNQNSGFYPNTGLPKLTSIAWKKQITNANQKYMDKLSYSEGVLYYTDFNTLYAISSFNGNSIWRYDSHRMINTGFTITRDVIYFGANSFMFAINKSDGKEIWRYLTNGSVKSSPVIDNGIIYFGSGDFFVYALNATTGELIWKFDSGYYIQSDPAILDGVVYIGNDDVFLYAIDAMTGKQIWKYKSPDFIKNPITVFEKSIFIINNNSITKIDSKTGKAIWKYEENFGDSSNVVIDNNSIYANTMGTSDDPKGKTIAINIMNGKKIWHFSSDKSKGTYGNSLVIANHIVYIRHSDHFLYALDFKSGKKLWEFNTGNASFDDIVIGEGVIFVSNVQDGYLCALK